MGRVSFEALFRRFYPTLEDSGVPYFAYGGIAVAVWGNPRETQDVDSVVLVDDDRCGLVLAALERAGFSSSDEEKRTFPIDGWIRMKLGGRHGDVALGRTPFDESAFSRRVRTTLFGAEIWMVSAEDLVLYKLVAYRRKDLADAESVIARQGDGMDMEYLRRWADRIARHSGKFEVPRKLEELLDEAAGE